MTTTTGNLDDTTLPCMSNASRIWNSADGPSP